MLGEGAMSSVVHCVCGLSGVHAAVKMYHRDRMNGMNVKQVSREIEIHASMLHPHIVRLYAAFEDADGIYLVQEYASRGELALGGGGAGRRGGEGHACFCHSIDRLVTVPPARPHHPPPNQPPPHTHHPSAPPRPHPSPPHPHRPPLPTAGDLYVELSRRGGYMPETHVVKGVLIPFLSALTYMHTQVGRGRGGGSGWGGVGWGRVGNMGEAKPGDELSVCGWVDGTGATAAAQAPAARQRRCNACLHLLACRLSLPACPPARLPPWPGSLQGVLHRDIKPENIMLGGDGAVKVVAPLRAEGCGLKVTCPPTPSPPPPPPHRHRLRELSHPRHTQVGDFGLAINTTREKPMSRVGTLDYMPPEVRAAALGG